MGTYKYSMEFRADAVALARSSGRPVSRIAAELGVNHETLRQWVKTAENAERPEAFAESTKDAEIAALRKQVRELEMEREAAVHRAESVPVRVLPVAADRPGTGCEEGRRRRVHPTDTQDPHRVREDVRRQADHRRAPRGRCDGEPQACGATHAPTRYPRTEVEAAAPHHGPGPRRPGGARSAAAQLHRIRPDRAWVCDITYLPIAGGKFLYLATVIDVFSRRLLGWSMADHMRAELVTDALDAAVQLSQMIAMRVPIGWRERR